MIPHGLAGLARTYEQEGNSEKAVRCYREAIAYSSEYPFHQALAALQIRMGDDLHADGGLWKGRGMGRAIATG
jgi:tetratricopeptide (TPR) repeat protein